MKRLTSLFLSLLMLLSLTACGGAGDVILDAALDAAMSAVQDYGSSDSSGPAVDLPGNAGSQAPDVSVPDAPVE
jgi:predicted small lipoprotein YifL